ncbi:MAG TPA: hypothetical protein PKX92_14260 [Edaphocola sp.]|nr:hypothetical protein [Edaphocola sp.]
MIFRETLTIKGIIENIFEEFTQFLEKKELIVNEEKLIDTSITIATPPT